jgi:hypothetical protein
MIKSESRYVWWLYDAPPLRLRSQAFGTWLRTCWNAGNFGVAILVSWQVFHDDLLYQIIGTLIWTAIFGAILAYYLHSKWVKTHPQDAYRMES